MKNYIGYTMTNNIKFIPTFASDNTAVIVIMYYFSKYFVQFKHLIKLYTHIYNYDQHFAGGKSS